ncbi:MAG TPA: hypothetical protein VFO85_05825, partial [Vicinamibacteria bacterium]|nr:hypothetical protein [Vicinamibacteria bacterium]
DGSRPEEAEVFLVAAGKAERRTVTLGIESAAAVQVVRGLAPGDQVVLDPPAALGPGTAIEVANPRQER